MGWFEERKHDALFIRAGAAPFSQGGAHIRRERIQDAIVADAQAIIVICPEPSDVLLVHGEAMVSIALPSNRYNFKNDESYLMTYGHEAIHSTLHKSRLNRQLSYNAEELVAELGSCLLAHRLEISNIDIQNHAGVIAPAAIDDEDANLGKMVSGGAEDAD